MAIHHIYVDSSVAPGGTGTRIDPFNTLADIATISAASGDTRYAHIKSGSVFYGERLPTGLTNSVGRSFWMDVYGGSTRPIIDSSTEAPSGSWILDGTHGFYTQTLGTNVFPDVATRLTIGALFEDGITMTMQLYNSDLAAMSTALTGGGYACDWATGIVYMKPTSGVPGDHTYRAATLSYPLYVTQTGTSEAPEVNALEHTGLRNPYTSDGRNWHFSFEGLRVVGGKWGGIDIQRGTTRVKDCEFYGHGGVQWAAYTIPHAGNSSHLGNAIGIGNDTRGVLIEDCLVEQTFDSGISPQTFNSGDVVCDVVIRNNTIRSCGFYSIEVSTHGTGATVRDVLIEGNHISDAGDCFGYPIHVNRFRGIGIIETGTTNIIDNVVVRNNIVENMEDTFGSGNGATAYLSTEGTNIDFSGNIARNCERHGFYLPIGASISPSDVTVKGNIVDGCASGIFVNGSVTATQIDLIGNKITNCDDALLDTSSVNTPVRLIQNTMNGTDAVDASRTTGITGYGNTSTGVKTGYEYLF